MDADLNAAAGIIASARETGRLPQLLAQLDKDFRSAGHLPFTGAADPSGEAPDARYVELLQERLYRLLMEDFDGYLNLMYSVDVPQRIFRQLRITDAVEVARQMAAAVLGREWQKVRFRAGMGPGD